MYFYIKQVTLDGTIITLRYATFVNNHCASIASSGV
jgi:hypothetical protein